METRNYKFACMLTSMYGLLQYLLLQDEDDARENTFYFIDGENAIPKSVAEHIPSIYPFELIHRGGNSSVFRFFYKFWFALTKYKRFPFLKSCKIYSQDLAYHLDILIGRRDYSLLAENPGFITLNAQMNSAEYVRRVAYRKSLMGRIDNLFLGPVCTHAYGDNNQCKEIFMTEENTSHVLSGKTLHIQSLQSMWDDSSESKKDFILDVFGVTHRDIEVFSSKPMVFFTQPMTTDVILNNEEYTELLKKIFGKFDIEKILIKTHPLDNYNYESEFPNIPVFRKKVNVQLLQLANVHIKQAVTICSTSVQNLPEETEVIWFGPCIHPKIESCFGKNYSISRPYTTISL